MDNIDEAYAYAIERMREGREEIHLLEMRSADGVVSYIALSPSVAAKFLALGTVPGETITRLARFIPG